MHYFDTSVLVTMLTAEPMTPEVTAATAAIGAPVISDWVLTEFSSALALKSRGGRISASDDVAAHEALFSMLEASFSVVPVSRSDFRDAAGLCRDAELGLRAGDALHLAVALAHSFDLVTRDQALCRAAELSGLTCVFLGDKR